MSVQVGQVWKDLDRRSNNRTVKVMAIIDDGARVEAVITDGEGNTGKTIRLKVDRLNAKGHWRLLKEPDGVVPEEGLDDAFAEVNDREADQMNQLVLFGTQEFVVDSVGLSKHGKITIAGAERTRDVLLKIYGAVQLWLGDHENAVEAAFGEDEASQVIDHEAYAKHGVSESTRKNWAWVAKRVPDDNRRVAQSWSHMQAVASLPPTVQRKFLEDSRSEDWSVSKLKTEIASRTEDGRTRLKFVIIVDAQTETKQTKLVAQLEAEGFKCISRQSVARTAKAKKEKKAVTAKRSKAPKINQRRQK